MIKFFKSKVVLLGYGNNIIGLADLYIRLDTWIPKDYLDNQMFFGNYKSNDIVNYLEIRYDEFIDLKEKS